MTRRHVASNPSSASGAANAPVVAAHPAPADQIGPTDFRAFGLTKAAYSVQETLEVLSIGRSSLYEAIGRGELSPVKFGRKTLLYAADLAAFLARLQRESAGGRDVLGRLPTVKTPSHR